MNTDDADYEHREYRPINPAVISDNLFLRQLVLFLAVRLLIIITDQVILITLLIAIFIIRLALATPDKLRLDGFHPG